MGLGYKKTDLQAIAQSKLDDAQLLLENKRPSNAYYLAGYAVELALKACIARQVSAETVPSKDLLRGFLDHDFKKLTGLAGLTGELKAQEDADPDFGANWAIVSEWSPDARYETSDIASAQTLIKAIDDSKAGVLTWIKKFW